MAKSKSKGIILIDRAKLDLYIEGMTNPISFQFLPNTVKDLEIINKEEFSKHLSRFIKERKLTPSFLIVIFSNNLLFQKTINQQSSHDIQKDIEEFLSEVPFERVGSKVYNLPNGGISVIAINKDFFEIIKGTFEELEFGVDGGIPLSLLNVTLPNKNQLDVISAQSTLSKIEEFKQFAIDLEKTEIRSESATSQIKKIKKPRPFLIILLSIFLVLVGILLVLLLRK